MPNYSLLYWSRLNTRVNSLWIHRAITKLKPRWDVHMA